MDRCNALQHAKLSSTEKYRVGATKPASAQSAARMSEPYTLTRDMLGG